MSRNKSLVLIFLKGRIEGKKTKYVLNAVTQRTNAHTAAKSQPTSRGKFN
jgi:hypothetical protein